MRTKKNSNENRTEHIPVRFSPVELMNVLRVAQEEHEYPSTFLRRVVLKHLDQREHSELSKMVKVA